MICGYIMQTDALILKTRLAREHDLLVHCYTERAGRLTAMARGALRPGSIQGMHLDKGNLVRFELVSAKGPSIITGAQAVDTFVPIRSELSRLAASWVLMESVDALVVGQERDEQLWQMLMKSLRHLAACPISDLLPVLRGHQRQLLSILGYAPHVSGCSVCGSVLNGRSTFSVHLGGVVCASCTRAGWYGSAVQAADIQWMAGHTNWAPCTASSRRAPTEELLEYIAGRPIRSLDLLFGFIRM
jgi:DNA repair protein RecO (recombination protein O)